MGQEADDQRIAVTDSLDAVVGLVGEILAMVSPVQLASVPPLEVGPQSGPD